jgi:flagellar hook-associated protein 3 FlgL
MMYPVTNGATQSYLASLDQNQSQMQQTQSQLSSGVRIQQPSDDAAELAEVLQLQTQIGQNQQIQTNLGTVSTELSTADSSLQTAVQALESAISLGTQGASSTATADQRSSLAQQVSGVLQTLVDISRTQVNGHYIFSGDQDTQPAYQVDSTQPEGVKQLISAPATRQIVDASGTSISVALTAQQIFDAQNSDGTPADGNVFNAVNSLLTSLQNNDQTGITNALSQLQSADTYLNNQLAFYGTAENRVSSAQDLAQKFQTQEQSNLGQLRDADVASLATQLSQEQVQQQAALSVESTMLQKKNLFSYLA